MVSGLEKGQGPVSKSDSVGCHGQLNSSSLSKQPRRNPLSGDVCSPVETHDMVPSLQDNPQGQAHSRVPECDGRPSVQINQVQSTESSLHPLVFKQICQVVHS